MKPAKLPLSTHTQITIMIVPTSIGQIFISDENSIRSDNPPIQKLQDNHIFVPVLAQNHNTWHWRSVDECLYDATVWY
jgi:hypothetical protein